MKEMLEMFREDPKGCFEALIGVLCLFGIIFGVYFAAIILK